MLNIYPKLAPMAGLAGYGGGPTGLGLGGAAAFAITTNAFGDRAITAGGYIDDVGNKGMNWIEYHAIGSCANGSDFGDLTEGRAGPMGVSNVARCAFGGGYNTSSPVRKNVIDYVAPATTGNASDFGDLSEGRSSPGGMGCDGRGIWGHGSKSSGQSDTMDYVAIDTTGNATDFGNATIVSGECAGGGNGEIFTMAGGYNGGYTNDSIAYAVAATPGNATDFGNLTEGRDSTGSMCSDLNGSDRCVVNNGKAGSSYSNVLDYITISTPANATDFGDATAAYHAASGTSDNSKGVMAGGNAGCANQNNCPNYNYIRQVTIGTTGNASNCATLANSSGNKGSSSGAPS